MNWEQLHNDFRQKYEGCYCNVLLEGYKTSRVFMLDFVEKTEKAPLLHLRNDEFGEVILKYDDSKSDIEFKLPSIGLYNYRNMPIMVRRLYQRQFRRGICNATVYASPIYNGIYSGFGVAGEGHLSEAMVQVLNTPTSPISLKEGINALDRVLGICLSPEFALGLSPRNAGQELVLWYYENPVGTVDPSARRLYLKEEQFKQEFTDFVSQVEGADDFTIYS